jgi:hypothetical protein
MQQQVEKRFWSLNRVVGLWLVVFLLLSGVFVWDIAKDMRAGQRRLAEVTRLDESERKALLEACVELAKREVGPVASPQWPAAVLALKPERVQVREGGVVVELNVKGLDYAAVTLSRESDADVWKLYLVNFDGEWPFWPGDERVP